MPKIETIFTHGLKGELGIDESGKLYWNKKLVLTKSKITFNWWVNASVIIASLSTLVMAIIAFLNYFQQF